MEWSLLWWETLSKINTFYKIPFGKMTRPADERVTLGYEITDSLATRLDWGQDSLCTSGAPSFQARFLNCSTYSHSTARAFSSHALNALRAGPSKSHQPTTEGQWNPTASTGSTAGLAANVFLTSNKKVQTCIFPSLKGPSGFRSFRPSQSDTHTIYLRMYFSHGLTDSLLWHEELVESS